MTPQGLELLIKQGEGYNPAFKQFLPSRASDLAEEICAFANAAGGMLLIGVDDKGKIVGRAFWKGEAVIREVVGK